MATLLAIRRHARRVQNGKSYFTVDQHMDAIVALTGIGLKANRRPKKVSLAIRNPIDTLVSNAKLGRGRKGKAKKDRSGRAVRVLADRGSSLPGVAKLPG